MSSRKSNIKEILYNELLNRGMEDMSEEEIDELADDIDSEGIITVKDVQQYLNDMDKDIKRKYRR